MLPGDWCSSFRIPTEEEKDGAHMTEEETQRGIRGISRYIDGWAESQAPPFGHRDDDRGAQADGSDRGIGREGCSGRGGFSSPFIFPAGGLITGRCLYGRTG